MNVFEVDGDGYLTDPSVWTPEWAHGIAMAQDLQLTDEHWDILHFIRAQHARHGVAPEARFAIRFLTQTRGAFRTRVFELFPHGYVAQACKLAGMLRPRKLGGG